MIPWELPTISRADGLVLPDGGMGQEIRRRGVTGPNTLWSAYALLAAPEVVRTLHEHYIKAGADVITTNTYVTSRG